MTIPRLNTREQKHLGIKGEFGVDALRRGDVFEILPSGAFLLDNPAQQVDLARPGDVVVIWTNVRVQPDETMGAAEVHPSLLRAGFCSFPRFLTADHGGPMSVLFRCEQEIDLTTLPYLFIVFSLGDCRQ
jgi:hypothetical protein